MVAVAPASGDAFQGGESPMLIGEREAPPADSWTKVPLVALSQTLGVIRGLSPLARGVWAALLCTNFAWFVSWMYIPAYMGVEVMGGDPGAAEGTEPQKLYVRGADLLASRAMLIQSTMSLFLCPLFPTFMRWFGGAWVWVFCELLHATVYFATWTIRDPVLAVADLGFQGFAWAAFLVVPYTMMGREAQGSSPGNEALYMSVMNLALCFPEILASAIVGPVVDMAGGSSTAPMVLAGFAALVAAVILGFLSREERKKNSNGEMMYESLVKDASNGEGRVDGGLA